MTYKDPIITLPLFRFRAWLMIRIVEYTGPIYCKIRMWFSAGKARYFQRGSSPEGCWVHQKSDLAHFEAGTLGNTLYTFLSEKGFELLPGAETHDVYHVLLEYGTTAVEEVCLQYCLYGSGKRSAYVIGAVVAGVFVFPEYWGLFRQAYRRGRKMIHFSKWSFEYLLNEPLELLKRMLVSGDKRRSRWNDSDAEPDPTLF